MVKILFIMRYFFFSIFVLEWEARALFQQLSGSKTSNNIVLNVNLIRFRFTNHKYIYVWNVEVVPNEPVPNVRGIATDTDLIQKIYSRCHIFYFSSQNWFPKDSWKDWGGGWEGPLLAVTHWKMDEIYKNRETGGEKKRDLCLFDLIMKRS